MIWGVIISAFCISLFQGLTGKILRLTEEGFTVDSRIMRLRVRDNSQCEKEQRDDIDSSSEDSSKEDNDTDTEASTNDNESTEHDIKDKEDIVVSSSINVYDPMLNEMVEVIIDEGNSLIIIDAPSLAIGNACKIEPWISWYDEIAKKHATSHPEDDALQVVFISQARYIDSTEINIVRETGNVFYDVEGGFDGTFDCKDSCTPYYPPQVAYIRNGIRLFHEIAGDGVSNSTLRSRVDKKFAELPGRYWNNTNTIDDSEKEETKKSN